MKKIVILGCENSHANMFLDFMQSPEYRNAETIGVYSRDADAANKLREKYGVPVLSTFDAAVGKADGVIVTARHGDSHYEFAAPYIASGVPMFIDKPITVDEREAVRFMRECKAAGVRLTGGSCCKYQEWVQTLHNECAENVDGNTLGGYVRCPVSLTNPNGGFFFYAQHLVETVLYIFGMRPYSVHAFSQDKALTVVFRYQGFDVVGLFAEENYSCYYAMRVSEHHARGAEFPINGQSPCFRSEFDAYYKLLQGGEQQISYEDLIAPVFVMNAIRRSMDSRREERVGSEKL